MTKQIALLAGILSLQGCLMAFAEDRSWAFVTAVGGLEVGAPVQAGNKWQLPVRADVSGLQTITVKPTAINSGLVCKSVQAKVKGQDIFLILETTLAHGNAASVCPAASLGRPAAGRYNLWYGTSRADGVALGTLTIPAGSAIR